jgi:putative glycosyltransferase (TIGR04348 family)
MDLLLITPAKPGSRHGNRHTATRWASLLRELGHRVTIDTDWKPAYSGRFQALIALHARRSHDAMQAWRASEGSAAHGKPIILALTGTDLYRDIHEDASAKHSLDLADRMVVLQAEGLKELKPKHRAKTHVIMQSVAPVPPAQPPVNTFLLTVIGHLRDEKDPFRAVQALSHLPDLPHLRVVQLGGAMSPKMEAEAQAWMQREPRYRWLGELPHWRTMRWLARSHAMVISSHMEGGAHVVSEAIDAGVPVLASKVSGNVGMLGADYPGYYRCADEKALAKLIRRVTNTAPKDEGFLGELCRMTVARKPLISRVSEKRGLKKLIQSAFS